MLKFNKFNESYDSGHRQHSISGSVQSTTDDKPTNFTLSARASGVKRIDHLALANAKPRLSQDQADAVRSHFTKHGHDGPATDEKDDVLKGTSGDYEVGHNRNKVSTHKVEINSHYASK
tara:strand:- start:1709 stop:2065 length:357 start_codon:yes stop_codon:yes gene_type:complete